MFFSASASVSPWLTQPGMAGHSAIYMPSSSWNMVIRNLTFIPPEGIRFFKKYIDAFSELIIY
jgi:hypothetical protein